MIVYHESWVVPARLTVAVGAKICFIIDSYTSWGGQTVQESIILLRGKGWGSFGGIDSGWVRVMSWALQLGTSFLFFVVVVVTVVILILLIDNSDEEDEEDADDNGIDDDCDDHE